jgi:hypothetical protein
MASRTYCDLDDVKRLLRTLSKRESKIRFSDAYKGLETDNSNQGNVKLSGVNFLLSYYGHETFTMTYTDSTSFDVISDVAGDLPSGTRVATYTATDRFKIPTSKWSGTSEVGDICYITSNSDISDDDGDGFILDASRYINGFLLSVSGSESNIDFINDPSVDIPDAIVYACIRYTAYEIFHSVYAGMSIDEDSPVYMWKKMADESIKQFMLGGGGGGSGPRWRARESLITELGVEGVGEGEIDIDPLGVNDNEDFDR